MFSGLKLPFLGKVTENADDFKFRIYAFVIRNPSFNECKTFFEYGNRYQQGIKMLEAPRFSSLPDPPPAIVESIEDNGC